MADTTDLSSDRTNVFGESLFLPSTFEHPRAGEYKDKPEEWWANKAVRIYVDILVDGNPMRAPLWLDFLRFEDQIADGVPLRMAIGRVQKKITGQPGEDVQSLDAGLEVPFCVTEVFDYIERLQTPEGGVYLPIASAG